MIEQHDRRAAFGRRAGKAEAQRRLILLGLSRGMVMNLNHHISTLANRQRKLGIVRRRRESGRPSTERTSHRNSRPSETRIASVGACGSPFFRSSARIQINQGVMHNEPVAGTKFNAVDIYIVILAGGQNEASILIRSIG